jgi:hypothetical protein
MDWWRNGIKGRHMMTISGVFGVAWVIMAITRTDHAGAVYSIAMTWGIFGYFKLREEKKRAAHKDATDTPRPL